MDDHGVRAGTAIWRRQRRLRAWWRHEQQTVAAVLATVTHHSHSKVGTANDAPRSQETVTSTGGTAGVGHRPSAAGAGPAAHRGPDG